jgi:hypothetical protein
MTFEEVLDQAIALLQRRGRVTYRTLKRQFQLDDAALEDLTVELIKGQRLAVDEDGEVLVWTGATAPPPEPASPPAPAVACVPRTDTPPYLVEKILTSRTALEGERKQITVLFADLKGSLELLADRNPEDARQLLDPVLERRCKRVCSAIMATKSAARRGSPYRSEWGSMPARWWCGPSATTCTWITRLLGKPPTWPPVWSSLPCLGPSC